MEANIEAVRKTDTSYFSSGPIRSNLINRNGGSLPRKLNLTNIPMRNGYYYNNYSHGRKQKLFFLFIFISFSLI